jgi:hypothetical protein
MTAVDVFLVSLSLLLVLLVFLFQSLLMIFFLVSWYTVYVVWMIN